MDEYDITRAARLVSDFTIDQLSNWYVRRNRRRFWKNEKGKDKTSAYQTLYDCLITLSKLIAPFSPFISDEVFRNLNSVTKHEDTLSVHLSTIPQANKNLIDPNLEKRMSDAQRIVYLVRAIRNKSNLKVRQPLKRILVPLSNKINKNEIESMRDIILDELNVKAIEYVENDADIVHKSLKPNFKVIGPKFGKSAQEIATVIKKMNQSDIKVLENEKQITIKIKDQEHIINIDDVEIIHNDIKGWLVESDNEITVALDTELTNGLIDEGFAREFVNRVQNMRKDAGFEVTDRIKIYYSASQRLIDAINNEKDYILTETLATSIDIRNLASDYCTNWDINGEKVEIGIERI